VSFIRLDIFLYERGDVSSREKARALIKDGLVYVNGVRETKPGAGVNPLDLVELRGELPFVGRGGLKLQGAFERFNLDVAGKVCADVGASTGGFTDCLLQRGAARVYCIDAGSGQLDPKLAADSRVVNLENTNIRYIKKEQISEKIDFICVDVSFISLELVLNMVYNLLAAPGEAVCLIKPQFEAGRGKVGKNGVVRDEKIHKSVTEKIASFSRSIGFSVMGLEPSPIKGGGGNAEFLIYLSKDIK